MLRFHRPASSVVGTPARGQLATSGDILGYQTERSGGAAALSGQKPGPVPCWRKDNWQDGDHSELHARGGWGPKRAAHEYLERGDPPSRLGASRHGARAGSWARAGGSHESTCHLEAARSTSYDRGPGPGRLWQGERPWVRPERTGLVWRKPRLPVNWVPVLRAGR